MFYSCDSFSIRVRLVMIKVRYIPNLFEDQRCEMETRNLNLIAILFSLSRKYPEIKNDYANGLSIRVNGRKISPFQWTKVELKEGDRVTIIQEVGYFFPIIWLALTNTAWGFSIAGLTFALTVPQMLMVASIAYTIYSYVSAPSPHKPKNALDSSPTYGWDGMKLSMQSSTVVPVVYGEHLTGGNLITRFITSDGDKNYINMLIALCEGEIEGIMKEDLSGVCSGPSDIPYILINNNPFSNFQNIVWSWRNGTQDQSIIPGFQDIKASFEIGGILITSGGYIYTTTNLDVQAFELRFHIPALFISYKGGYYPETIKYRVYHRVHGAPDWIDDGEQTITACSQNTLRRYFRKDSLAEAQYDIKIVLTQGNWGEPYHQNKIYLDQIVEINYDDLAYVHSALLSIKVLATDQLSGQIPNVLTRIRGKKVLNLATSIAEWSKNPIWCVNDLLVNERYGAGRFISQANIDNDQLIEQAQYCDEKVGDGTKHAYNSCTDTSLTDSDFTFVSGDVGKTLCVKSPADSTLYTKLIITSISADSHTAYGTAGWSGAVPTDLSWEWGEPRFELDMVLDEADNALSMIQTVCASFRASPLWIKDALQIIIDKKQNPSYVFNMGNIISGSFKHVFGSDKKKPNTIEIQFANKENRYQRTSIEVDDKEAFLANNPRRIRKMSLLGATRLSQVYREGRFHLRAAQYQDEAITFKAGIDAVNSLPGDVVKFQHDVPQWGYGGRIMTATINSITLDQEVQLEAGYAYVVVVKLPAAGGGENLIQRAVSNAAGYYNVLNVSSDFPSVPPVGGLYLFGKENVESKPFRISRLSKTPQNEIEIESGEYSDNVYIDTDVILPTPVYSDLLNPNYVPQVENLQATEIGNVLKDGTWVPALEIGFKIPETSSLIAWSHAEIYISNTGQWFEYYGKTDSQIGFKIENHVFLNVGETVYVKAVSVAKNGTRAVFEEAPIVWQIINGKQEPPTDIANFNVTQVGDKLSFTWDKISDRDILNYQIREGTTWPASQLVIEECYGNQFTLFDFISGIKNYLIKAVDRHGNFSQNPASYEISVVGSSLQAVIASLDGLVNPSLVDLMLQYGAHSVYRAVSLKPTQGWDDAGVWDDDSKWDLPCSPLTGYFETEAIDFGLLTTLLVLLDDSYIQDGINQSATIECKTSDNGTDWTAYAPFVAGEYKCRYIKFKVTLSTTVNIENIFATKFYSEAGLSKPISIRFTNQTIAAGGTTIQYGHTFNSAPSVNVTPVGSSALIPLVTDQTTTQCTIKLFNTSAVDVGGNANITVEGF